MEMPDGEVEELPSTETGQVQCEDAEVHLPSNLGEEAGELLVLELKGREALEN